MAAFIKMPLGMEVDLGPGDFVLDGDPAPSPKRGRSPYPIFGKVLLWPNGWMHHDATWYGGRSQPRDFVFDGDPAPLPKKGRSPLPNFRPVSIVAKRLDESCKMALDMEVSLGPGHIVLDGEPASLPQKGGRASHNF